MESPQVIITNFCIYFLQAAAAGQETGHYMKIFKSDDFKVTAPKECD